VASETVRTFLRFFLQIQKRDFTLFDLLHALFRTLDMLAFAACGAVRAAIDRYLVSAGPTAANPPHAAASVDNWGRHSDSRRTDTVALHRPCRILHASSGAGSCGSGKYAMSLNISHKFYFLTKLCTKN